MSSKTADPPLRSAAWRISLWATLAYACGTMMAFAGLHNFVARDLQRRNDAWLSGEAGTLADVAERTPKDALYGRVVSEVAELAEKEVPDRLLSGPTPDDAVFFLQTGAGGAMKLWVGAGNGRANWQAIQSAVITPGSPTDIDVKGFAIPYRVAAAATNDGSRIYLGLSERDQLRVLRHLRQRFLFLWLLLVLLGFGIVFATTRRMLSHVRKITQAASRIGHSDLTARVPTTNRNDEVSHLAHTLNHMLERIENAMHQLHTITDALAHDLRSPLTAIRGKLEMSLSTAHGGQAESIVSALEEVDRLTDFLNKSLDVAEAKADALRLIRSPVDLDEVLRIMIDLYEPSLAEKNIRIALDSRGPLKIEADEGLIHRMLANLFDNELKHLPPGHSVRWKLESAGRSALLTLEDDGPGFDPEIAARLFERRVKGNASNGHGLGMAFVDAVARAHGGSATACNRQPAGARIVIALPVSAFPFAPSASR